MQTVAHFLTTKINSFIDNIEERFDEKSFVKQQYKNYNKIK